MEFLIWCWQVFKKLHRSISLEMNLWRYLYYVYTYRHCCYLIFKNHTLPLCHLLGSLLSGEEELHLPTIKKEYFIKKYAKISKFAFNKFINISERKCISQEVYILQNIYITSKPQTHTHNMHQQQRIRTQWCLSRIRFFLLNRCVV